MRTTLVVSITLAVLASAASAQTQAEAERQAIVLLPAGARLAVVEGDPFAPAAFTMRLRMPDGYTIPPHFHPVDEHVTVLQGTFLVGMGDRFDEGSLTELPTGSFGMLPTGMHHFARARGEVTLQLHGVGPWGLTYVNPADDPRSAGS
jgi:quercetin dioxygenase-like cupin family protein